MKQLQLKQKMSTCFKVVLAAVTAISMGGVGEIATYANEATTAAPTSYSISTHHDEEIQSISDYDQHVVLNLTFDDTVTITDADALNNSIFGENPTYTISISGRSIASSTYHRSCEYSANENTLTIDIGNVMTDSDSDGTYETEAFTAIYNGLMVANGTLSGVTVGSTSGITTSIKTFIPNGVELEMTSGEKTNALTMNVAHVANVRSMYHFVVYNYQDGEYIPVTASTGISALGSAAYSLSSHAHVYYNMNAATLAANIVSTLNNNFIDGSRFSATDNGDGTFTINSTKETDQLVMYMYNDNFIQSSEYVTPTVPSSETISLASSYATAVNDKADGTGYYEYALTASSDDAMPVWVANVDEITVGDITYTLVCKSSSVEDAYTTTESDETTTQYAYLFQDGDGYKLRLASYPLTAAKSYTVKITNAVYEETSFEIWTAKKSTESTITTETKKANYITVKTTSKTIKAKLKNKKTTKKYTFKIGAASKTSVKVVKKSGNKKITVSSKGKVTVKKGIKAGTYKVKVKITAASSSKYKKATKTVTLKIKVKNK
ncbi:hypothetical protein [Eubacterium oxidoreducens]|uniref:Uncharacterized protein n=1 Tax=Eubacterium oxidoreducens TaxID=1732 RepID=A0A1G6BNZ1_EUBOX|nr:hypothetical protein [Eubacterium oxidoreducens]SDB22295.1 hypothetical protein SAMN02910417_01679 [Eubacterium oxidoreducens]